MSSIMKPCNRLLTTLLLAAALAGPAVAAEDRYEALTESENDFTPGKSWREGEVKLPPPPREEDLLPIDLDLDPYRSFIDRAHLSVGEDRVTRYTLVIRSPQGSENVLYEGVHCATGRYRSYGYRASDGGMRPMRRSEWRPLHSKGRMAYHKRLADYYFCVDKQPPLSPERIIDRVRYSERRGMIN